MGETLSVKSVFTLTDDINYYFIRTHAGTFFNEFLERNVVGTSWDELDKKGLESLSTLQPDSKLFKDFKENFKNDFPKLSKPGSVINQMLMFYRLKKGDIVLIPDEHSENIAIGMIKDDNLIDEFRITNEDDISCSLFKKVTWLRVINKQRMDPYLYKVRYIYQGITNINSYAQLIDRSFKDVYTKNNISHVIFNINNENNINALDMLNFSADFLEFVDLMNKEYFGYDVKLSSYITIKTYLNSPGKNEFELDNERLSRVERKKRTPKSGFEVQVENLLEKVGPAGLAAMIFFNGINLNAFGIEVEIPSTISSFQSFENIEELNELNIEKKELEIELLKQRINHPSETDSTEVENIEEIDEVSQIIATISKNEEIRNSLTRINDQNYSLNISMPKEIQMLQLDDHFG